MFDKINKFVAKYSYNDNIKKVLLQYDASANIKLNNNFFEQTNKDEFQ